MFGPVLLCCSSGGSPVFWVCLGAPWVWPPGSPPGAPFFFRASVANECAYGVLALLLSTPCIPWGGAALKGGDFVPRKRPLGLPIFGRLQTLRGHPRVENECAQKSSNLIVFARLILDEIHLSNVIIIGFSL